jgi:hypothetical protein
MATESLCLTLTGLEPAPCQVWRTVRILPLIGAPVEELRLHPLCVKGHRTVHHEGRPEGRRTVTTGFVPSGLVFAASADLAAVATEAWMGEMGEALEGPVLLRLHAARDGALRILPQQVALEGLLSRHFGGTDTARAGWSTGFLREGLSPRSITLTEAIRLPGLAEALAHFELLPDQRGMMLFVGDCLMGAVVTPHPDDYRVVHASTVCDLLAPVFVDWSLRAPTVQAGAIRLDSEGISNLDTLEAALGAARRDWAMTVVEGLASRLIGRTVSFTPLRTLRGHRLGRFVTGFDPGSEEHLGELILSPGGRLGYLKILRLPPEEVRKAAFLESLAALDWDLVKVQESMGLDRGGLRRAFARQGLAWMLAPEG